MLMNNHDNHITPEFIVLVNENHIRPYSLIAHLIHCMQFLDVGIFQSFKHWHDVTIQKTIAESLIEYFVPHFLQNLIKIRNSTFKSTTIQHAFEKSEMWPVNAKLCIKQLKIFNPDPSHINDKSFFSLPRQTHSQQITDVEFDLIEE